MLGWCWPTDANGLRLTAGVAELRVAQAARLILIDDVFTTGATLDAAARTLLAAGVAELRVATVARVW